jgi:hypothetical protein
MTLWFPNPTQAGNCIVVGIQSGTSVSGAPTVADDKTNTYTLGPDIVGGQRVTLRYALNVAAGTQKITVSYTGASPAFDQVVITEWMNVATASAADGSNKHATGNTSPATTGSFTTAVDGDLIISFFCDETTGPPTAITGYTAGTGMTLITANNVVGSAMQYGIQTTHGAINPSITFAGGSDSMVGVGLALKSAASGSVGSGMRIFGEQHVPAYASVITTSAIMQFPTTGNLVAASVLTFSTGLAHISSISDTHTNTWAAAAGPVSGLSQVENEIWYAGNATADTANKITFNWTSTLAGTSGGDTHIVMYDIVGANTSPLDNGQTSTGTQNVTANLSTVSITPATANGVILCQGDITSHTASGTAGVASSDICVEPGMNGGGNDLDEDALWAHYYNPDTSAVTFTFTIQNNTAPNGVGAWGAVAAAFKAPGAAFNPGWATGATKTIGGVF